MLDGFDDGFCDGLEDGFDDGFDDGFCDGWEDGFDDGFAGFVHTTTQAGGSSSSPIGQNFVSPALYVPSPESLAPALVFSSFLGRYVTARKPTPAPVFSGFGHSTRQMGGNPPLVGKTKTPRAP